ncbi:hypothetical protein HELRODRAFT_166585 [Helobdella robusta]|uniref:SUEL-type lectin domain-containing protein n=1 Tax=Helobdella robusta TaxID=6412 RepID=T1EYA0_HELRO|nr:hypothetical protein HELRODRAFT_166585 [Helobdella robusta]ESO11577.1 hypothetical protein HELRODRAFT_166585 [Helobdella robusta]
MTTSVVLITCLMRARQTLQIPNNTNTIYNANTWILYFNTGQFQATCPETDIIFVTSAFFGRMRQGPCVQSNFGYLGCFNDVTGHVHRRCSGRQTCSIRLPDSNLLERTKAPCNDDLKSYLEVNFTCVTGKCDLLLQFNLSHFVQF